MIHPLKGRLVFLVSCLLGFFLAGAGCQRAAAPQAADATATPVPPPTVTPIPVAHAVTVWLSVNAAGHTTAVPDSVPLSVAASDYAEWRWNPSSPVKPVGDPDIQILPQPGNKCQGKQKAAQPMSNPNCPPGKHCRTAPATNANYGCQAYEITVTLPNGTKVKTDPEIEVDN